MKGKAAIKAIKPIDKAGGKIIRDLVIQLKNAGYVKNYGEKEEDSNSGLFLTKTGRSELDKIASGLMKK